MINRDGNCMDLWCDSVRQAARMLEWSKFLGLESCLCGKMVSACR